MLNNPLVLNFSGLGNFSKNVLYANIEEGEQKERLVKMAGQNGDRTSTLIFIK